IETIYIQPLYRVCFVGMIFSYLVALPEERRHPEHQQHAAAAGHRSSQVDPAFIWTMRNGYLHSFSTYLNQAV
ncbi:unnamed protein product, partial [Musa banksii]